MKITTDRKKTFDAVFAHAPTMKGTCIIELKDSRTVTEIAKDFDGLETITKESENEGDAVYIGFDTLISVTRNIKKGTALLTLERSKADD